MALARVAARCGCRWGLGGESPGLHSLRWLLLGLGSMIGGIVFCSACGFETADDAAFCSKCGKPLAVEAAAPAEPVVVDGVTYKPGSGQFAGMYAKQGGPWVRIEDGRVVKVNNSPPRSTGRVIGGVIALFVAVVALWQGFSWFGAFIELDAEGNPFAGTLALLGFGALVVAAGFGIWGIVLVSRK